MKLQQLAYFQAAYKCENMSMASRELHISQPSISMAIQELEYEFNTVLFTRTGKKLLPTKEGDLLFSMTCQLFDYVNSIKKSMEDLRHPANSIHLGLTPMIDAFLFTPILKAYLRENPDMHLSISEHGSERLEEAIKMNAIDCAIITHMDPISMDFMSIPIATVETVFCVNENNPLSQCDSIDINQIVKGPLVLFKEGYLITRQIHSRIEAAGISLNSLNVYYSDQLSTVKNFISEDIAAGFLYRPIAETIPNVRANSISPPLVIHISLLWKNGYEHYPHMRRFINYIQKNIDSHFSDNE